MIANILRVILLGQFVLAVAIGWAVWRVSGSLWWAGFAAAVLPALLHLLFLGAGFAISVYVNHGNVAARLSMGSWLTAWLKEWRVSMLTFHWRQPLRVNAVADSPEGVHGRGVIFVHGYFCNRGMWAPLMRRLEIQGVPVMAITLEPAFGSIDAYATPVRQAVERMCRANGDKPIVVGHSMGGLAIRAYIAAHGSDAVARLITIGTPHHGTYHAQLGRGANAKQMRLDSEWQRSNAAKLSIEDRAKFTCIYSNADNIVAPFESAMLADADNRHVPGCGHMTLGLVPQVDTAIAQALQS
jgi:triacylglycerol lipase